MSEASERPYFILAPERPTARSCSSVIARNSAGSIDGTAASSRSQIERAACTETCWPTIERISPPKPRGTSRSSGWPTSLIARAKSGSTLARCRIAFLRLAAVEDELGHGLRIARRATGL